MLPGCFWLAAKLQLTSRQMHDLKDELLLAPYLDLLFSFVLAWFLGNHCKPYCMIVKETRNGADGTERCPPLRRTSQVRLGEEDTG